MQLKFQGSNKREKIRNLSIQKNNIYLKHDLVQRKFVST